jgi:hypothetical protein
VWGLLWGARVQFHTLRHKLVEPETTSELDEKKRVAGFCHQFNNLGKSHEKIFKTTRFNRSRIPPRRDRGITGQLWPADVAGPPESVPWFEQPEARDV